MKELERVFYPVAGQRLQFDSLVSQQAGNAQAVNWIERISTLWQHQRRAIRAVSPSIAAVAGNISAYCKWSTTGPTFASIADDKLQIYLLELVMKTLFCLGIFSFSGFFLASIGLPIGSDSATVHDTGRGQVPNNHLPVNPDMVVPSQEKTTPTESAQDESAQDESTQDEPAADGPDRQENIRDKARQFFMRGKLNSNQLIVEGLTTKNFQMIADGAQNVKLLVKGEHWFVLDTPNYKRLSTEMETAATQLQNAANAKNMEGAALRYFDLTLNCIDCHRYIENSRY